MSQTKELKSLAEVLSLNLEYGIAITPNAYIGYLNAAACLLQYMYYTAIRHMLEVEVVHLGCPQSIMYLHS